MAQLQLLEIIQEIIDRSKDKIERQNRSLILKDNAPFISCITRVNG